MKFLIEINDNPDQFEADVQRGKYPGLILGSDKDMTLDAVFSKEDIWNEIKDNPYLPSITEIESYGKDAFLGSVVRKLNHEFDAELGINWRTVSLAIQDTASSYKDFHEKIDKQGINLDGLRNCLLRYDQLGKRGHCGPWTVHDGGYDLLWELCYNSKPVVCCYKDGSDKILERSSSMSDKTFSEICDMVHSVFPECLMSPIESHKIQENKSIMER